MSTLINLFRRPFWLMAIAMVLVISGINIAASRHAFNFTASPDCPADCRDARDKQLEKCDEQPEQRRDKCKEIINKKYEKCLEMCNK